MIPSQAWLSEHRSSGVPGKRLACRDESTHSGAQPLLHGLSGRVAQAGQVRGRGHPLPARGVGRRQRAGVQLAPLPLRRGWQGPLCARGARCGRCGAPVGRGQAAHAEAGALLAGLLRLVHLGRLLQPRVRTRCAAGPLHAPQHDGTPWSALGFLQVVLQLPADCAGMHQTCKGPPCMDVDCERMRAQAWWKG